jgi:hypothetical protein
MCVGEINIYKSLLIKNLKCACFFGFKGPGARDDDGGAQYDEKEVYIESTQAPIIVLSQEETGEFVREEDLF